MSKLVDDQLIGFAESLQLPDRVVQTDDIPWIPFVEDKSCHFNR